MFLSEEVACTRGLGTLKLDILKDPKNENLAH